MPSIVQLFNTLMKCTGANGNKAFYESNHAAETTKSLCGLLVRL